MTIHIVRNEHGDEVAAYTDYQHARLTAAEFEYFSARQFTVETLICEISTEDKAVD